MLKEFFDRLREVGAEPRLVHTDDLKTVFSINGDLKEISIVPPLRGHKFTSLEGLIDYLNSDRSGIGTGVVFVGETQILAELAYMERRRETAGTALRESEEFRGLMELTKGVAQKRLWELLVTVLFDSMNKGLLLQIQNLGVKIEKDGEISIQRSGLTDAKVSAKMTITCAKAGKADERGEVNLDWTWKGRIWECWDREFEIPLTLELNVDEGLRFIFHPNRLETRLREARLALAAHLQGKLNSERFRVYEGTF
ncbi:MAG: hypothetical protein ABFD89_22675 [Bryobacteraceae bacterium]